MEILNPSFGKEDVANYCESAHFAYTVLSDNHWDRDELWQNKCEIAMHVFCLNCIHDGGYWTDVKLPHDRVNKQRKRSARNDDLVAMPTMDGPEPQSMTEARTWHTDSEKYVAAGEKEMSGHYKNGTFVPCEMPVDAIPIDTKLFFVRKTEEPSAEYPDGIRHKGRLVARGFSQVDGQNFNWDTVFAPVLRAASIRWLFSLAAQKGWSMSGSDVVQAFLQADLKNDEHDSNLQDVYIRLPDGCEYTCPKTGKVFKYARLQKALYGLKQAPKRWNVTLSEFLTKKLGFVQHEKDPCVYQLVRGKDVLILGVYVDDLIKVTNCDKLRCTVDGILNEKFEITHSGNLNEFLGMKLTYKTTPDGRRYLDVSQEKYVEKILKRFQLHDCNIKSTPSASNTYLTPREQDASTNDPEYVNMYRQMVGALIHLVVLTRPDIAYDVSAASVFMSNPSGDHTSALVRIFRYLRGTSDYTLKYFDIFPNILSLTGFVDSNFAGDYDTRSVTGFLFTSGSGLVSWLSKRQPTISTSASHAECTAFFHAVKETIMHRDCLEHFKFQNIVLQAPTIIYGDNSACIQVTSKQNSMG